MVQWQEPPRIKILEKHKVLILCVMLCSLLMEKRRPAMVQIQDTKQAKWWKCKQRVWPMNGDETLGSDEMHNWVSGTTQWQMQLGLVWACFAPVCPGFASGSCRVGTVKEAPFPVPAPGHWVRSAQVRVVMIVRLTVLISVKSIQTLAIGVCLITCESHNISRLIFVWRVLCVAPVGLVIRTSTLVVCRGNKSINKMTKEVSYKVVHNLCH